MTKIKIMLYSIYAESTPNPTAMKFVANRRLVKNSMEFKNEKEAKKLNIAQKLFAFPFIENVFISNNFISIAKNRSVEWENITMQLREFIVDHLNKHGIENYEPKEEYINSGKETRNTKTKKDVTIKSETEKQIVQLINQYVKPAVESDGGAIDFYSFKSGVVTVILKGSCSGCPSSQATLKQGVERLLKDKLGDQIQSVIALNK